MKMRIGGFGIASAAALLAVGSPWAHRPVAPERLSLIVQGRSAAAVADAVRAVGGQVTHELPIIDAVAAQLTPRQRTTLMAGPDRLRSFDNPSLRVAADPEEDENGETEREVTYPMLVGVSALHEQGVDGSGVTVATLDTGYWSGSERLRKNGQGQERVAAVYNSILDREKDVKDKSGHGTHVSSIILASDRTKKKKPEDPERFGGMAPNARLVSVQAFDEEGRGTYADVIRGIGWVVRNKDLYGIRVLNCSFGAPVRSHYWEDPLNQAVLRAWQAGIVVVVSAGNRGPAPMTVEVPGNVPYVITVGAITDNYTPDNLDDDRLASFSAAGPTYEGFVKPDLLAPGGHVVGIMSRKAALVRQHPEFATEQKDLFIMSGTSQAAAVVSGAAALMLQADPTLSPDDVKCGLMATARAARAPGGGSPYGVFQQGAGLVRADDAVHRGGRGCANLGLDIAADLAGTRHFGGPASQDSQGAFYLMDQAGTGTTWNGGGPGPAGYPWSNGYPWSTSYPWSSGYPWSNSYPWSSSCPWSNGYPWASGLAEPASINVWAPQE